ncbi:MAG: alpha/beta hydrolase [Sediminibacterium sp.]|nr:alpha/beta hydrolase [Sediminibacterium sp.]
MKETIVFIHGICHGSWCWEEQFVPYFEKLGYNCISFNLPGHETEGSLQRISYSLGDYVQALRKVVESLEEPPVIIGHSMGGMILQHFLQTGTCKKAVLMSSVPPSGALVACLRVISRYPGLIPYLVRRNLLGAFTKYPYLMFNKTLLTGLYAHRMCAESFKAFLGLLIPVSHTSSIPILVVGGSKDALIRIRDLKSTANYFNAKLTIIEGGSHDLMLDEDFEKSALAIAEWI